MPPARRRPRRWRPMTDCRAAFRWGRSPGRRSRRTGRRWSSATASRTGTRSATHDGGLGGLRPGLDAAGVRPDHRLGGRGRRRSWSTRRGPGIRSSASGRASGFYSPFWQIVYFDVPAGTDHRHLHLGAGRSSTAGYPLTPSQGQTMPLVPGRDHAAPGSRGPAGSTATAVSFLNFGAATSPGTRPTSSARRRSLPDLVGSRRRAARPRRACPRCSGTSPPGIAPAAPLGSAASPRYAAYWRLYTVPVPPFARVFAPPGSQAEADL